MLFGHNFAQVPHDISLCNASTNDTTLQCYSEVIRLFSVNKLTTTHRLFFGVGSHKFHRQIFNMLFVHESRIHYHSICDGGFQTISSRVSSKLSIFDEVGHGFQPRSQPSCVCAVAKLAYPDNRAVIHCARAYSLCPRRFACPA